MQEKSRPSPVIDSLPKRESNLQPGPEDHLHRLIAIGRIISSSLDIQEIYDRFAAEVRHMLPLDRTTIAILTPDRQAATLTYIWGLDVPKRRPGSDFSLSGTMGETVVRNATGLRIQIDDADEFSRRFPALSKHWEAGLRSFLALPLMSRGNVIGLLFLNSAQTNAYSLQDLQLAESISNQIAGAIANAQHHAERQNTLERLKESEERYRNLVDGSVQGILIHRNAGPLFVNQAYATLFGYQSPNEIMALGTPHALHSPEELSRLRRYADLRLRGEPVPSHYELQGIRKDGEIIWLENRVRAVEWQGESALQCTYIDITARKQAEAHLQQTQRELEHRVRERSADLEQVNQRLRAEITDRQHIEATLRKREDHLHHLAEISRIINSRLNLREVYEGFAHAVQRLIPFDRIAIATLDESQQYGTVAYVWGHEVPGRYPGDQYEIGDTLYGASIKAGTANRVQFRHTAEFRSQYPESTSAANANIQSLLVLPLVLNDMVIGIMYLSSTLSQLYTEHHLRVAESISSQIAGVVANADHYAERQRAADVLRESEERFRNLIEGSIQGILIHCDSKPLFVNQAWADLFGYSTDEILEMPSVLSMCAETDQDRIQRHHAAYQQGEAVAPSYDYQGIRQDGSVIWLDCKETRVMWQGCRSIQSTIFDITERKRLEEQVRQTQKMEAIGTLAGGIAHDFNNILGAIIGYTQLAAFDLPDHHITQASLHEVLTASGRARQLVEQILTFSRRDTHQHKPLLLHDLVHEVLTLLRASLPSTIVFQIHFDPEAGIVMADPIQLHQVVMNLCANAEHAMRSTGGILEVRVEAVEVDPNQASQIPALNPGDYTRLTISDTGHGMSPEVRARIFEPFYTTKDINEGSGMGLAVVHGIILNHGGAITVKSTLGKGTRFDIYLPQTSASPLESQPDAPLVQLTDCHREVLLVDDEEMLIQAGQQLLSRLGYTVTACTNSQQALAKFEATPERFDVVITDQTMPEMSGERLVQAIRRIRGDIPVILCTGFSHVMDAKRAQSIGINAFLTKPLTTQVLSQTIQKVCTESTPLCPKPSHSD